MQHRTKAYLLGLCAIAGILMYAWYHNIIVIQLHRFQNKQQANSATRAAIKRRTVQMHYWHQNRWKSEGTKIIWNPKKKNVNIARLAQAWFTLLEEDNLLSKRVTVQSCALSGSQSTAFLSLDRSPFEEQSSIRMKWLIIEGLLKTIRSNTTGLSDIHLLCHNQPIKDYHIDFEGAWPVSGFYKD
jgi:hypothetical protein